MANAIKYKSGNLTGSLQKNNVSLGISGSLGPSSTTDWYSSITPASGKYNIIETFASGVPQIYCPANDAELIRLAKVKGATGADTGSATAILAWIGTQTNLMASNFDYENIVTNGLVLNVDAGYVGSYPTVNNTWYDISGGNITGTLTNGPTFNSSNSGSLLFDGTNDYVTFGNQNLGIDLTNKSFCVWVKLSATQPSNPVSIIDKQFDNTPPTSSYGGWGFWMGSDRKLWWWSMPNQDIRDTGSATVGLNVWTHIATTYNYSTKTATFYINGSLNSSGTSGSIVDQSSGTQPLVIGATRVGQANQGGYVSGSIANVLAYNRVLTLAEVQQNYNAQRTRFGV
jgi:hypothetical protein